MRILFPGGTTVAPSLEPAKSEEANCHTSRQAAGSASELASADPSGRRAEMGAAEHLLACKCHGTRRWL